MRRTVATLWTRENVGSREKNTEDQDGQDRGQLHLVVMIQQTVR